MEAPHDQFVFTCPNAELGGVSTEEGAAGGVPPLLEVAWIAVGCPDGARKTANIHRYRPESVDGKVYADCCFYWCLFRLEKRQFGLGLSLGVRAA